MSTTSAMCTNDDTSQASFILSIRSDAVIGMQISGRCSDALQSRHSPRTPRSIDLLQSNGDRMNIQGASPGCQAMTAMGEYIIIIMYCCGNKQWQAMNKTSGMDDIKRLCCVVQHGRMVLLLRGHTSCFMHVDSLTWARTHILLRPEMEADRCVAKKSGCWLRTLTSLQIEWTKNVNRNGFRTSSLPLEV